MGDNPPTWLFTGTGVFWTLTILPILGYVAFALCSAPVSPWLVLLFAPGLVLHLWLKAGDVPYQAKAPQVIRSKLPHGARYEVTKRLRRIEEELIMGFQAAASLISVVLAASGFVTEALLCVGYGMMVAHFLSLAKQRRDRREWLDDAVDKVAREQARERRRQSGEPVRKRRGRR